MPNKTQQSRFSPSYLVNRHAGAVFLCLAVGVVLGTVWRSLIEPTRYSSTVAVGLSLTPPEAAAGFDWENKRREWRALLDDDRECALLANNLRHIVKLASTRDARFDTEQFAGIVAGFETPQEYSASLFGNALVARVGPTITVSRRDLAANLDFQSLAAIISDLDPQPGIDGWDFSFFHAHPGAGRESGMVTRPGREDRFFRVFYRLHDILNPNRPAGSPETAWRTAVDILIERLEREAQFAGGGGFGHTAKRELLREVSAIPPLAANSLYHAGGWAHGVADFRNQAEEWRGSWSRLADLELVHRADAAEATVTAARSLHPLARPRDTVFTRIPHLVAATVLAHLADRESRIELPAITVRTVVPEQPAPVVVSAPAPVPEPAPVRAVVVADPVPVQVESAEAARWRTESRALEQSRPGLVSTRDAARRRLEAARESEKRLSREAIAARTRADRLGERYDAALLVRDDDRKPEVPPETARLLQERDALVKRLAALLQYCTEEHPFVKETRRDLAALDIMLGEYTAAVSASADAEARATRIANLFIEHETAVAAADSLEERLRRLTESVNCMLGEVGDAERKLTAADADILRLREKLQTAAVATPAPAPVIAPIAPIAPPPPLPPLSEPPPPVQPVRQTYETRVPRLVFGPLSASTPLLRTPPSILPQLIGALLGLCAGLCWLLTRELFSGRFADGYEAGRLLAYPVLAALPAYDAGSFRRAARAMKGELHGSRTRAMLFTPAAVDMTEPPAAGRRERLAPARRRQRLTLWAIGLLLLFLSGVLQWSIRPAISRAEPGQPHELPVPAPAVYAPADQPETSEDWEDDQP